MKKLHASYEARYVAQSDRYAAEVYSAEGEGHAYKVMVHDRDIGKATDETLPIIPAQYFDTFAAARKWADESAFRRWSRADRIALVQ